MNHPFSQLRRKDRAMDKPEDIEAVLDRATILYLGLADGGSPFVVPLFYTRVGKSLYFHSASAGTKVEILKKNPSVSFVVSVDHGIIPDEKPCDFEARHQTVMGYGKAHFVTDAAEKLDALKRIVARFTDQQFEYPQANLDRTLVVRIDVDHLTGKRHGF